MCKECMKEYSRRYRTEHRAEVLASSKEWYSRNRDKAAESNKKWHSDNRERHNERARDYGREHAEDINFRRRARRALNPSKDREACSRWRSNNSWYKAHKRANDPAFRLAENLRQRVRAAMKGERKSECTMGLIGCSALELRRHIETLWLDGMSWDNYGLHGWHVDHIIPCAVFELADPVEQKQCFHHTNLQPLWAEDNLAKRAGCGPTLLSNRLA